VPASASSGIFSSGSGFLASDLSRLVVFFSSGVGEATGVTGGPSPPNNESRSSSKSLLREAATVFETGGGGIAGRSVLALNGPSADAPNGSPKGSPNGSANASSTAPKSSSI